MPSPHPFTLKTLALAALLVLAACSARVAPVEERLAAGRIPFLCAGETTQQEVFQRLGVPHGAHEDGLVLIYRMGEDPEGRMFVLRGDTRMRAADFYELVLLFGTDLRLEKYTLVRKQ